MQWPPHFSPAVTTPTTCSFTMFAKAHLALVSLLATLSICTAQAPRRTTASWDAAYDVANSSMETTACSSLSNTEYIEAFGQLPRFPLIAASFFVTGQGAAECGSCWELTWNGRKNPMRIHVVVMDAATRGFVLSKRAMDALTSGQATKLGRIDVEYQRALPSACGW
jgi:Cerato-platanin